MTSLHDALRFSGNEATNRIGKASHALVTAVDPRTHTVKVTIQPDGVESGWIQDPGLAAGGLRISSPAEIGTQVLVESAEGDAEHPVIVARLFDDQVLPPMSPLTNAPAAPGELLIAAGQPAPEGSSSEASSDAPWLHVTATEFAIGAGTARLLVTSSGVTITVGDASYVFGPAGLVVTKAQISSDTDVLAKAVSLLSHIHTSVKAGSDLSGVPQQ